MQIYSTEFYQSVQAASRRSAEEVVPIVLELIQPQSVVDVGCGTGTWLAVFQQHGVEDVLGIDGDYVDRQLLEIPTANFLPYDLTTPLTLDRPFDLAISLEVGEHLPLDRAATFVASLTQLAPVILFSAAIPFQGGENHINEQWLNFWATLFQAQGYVAIDAIRNRIWQNENVDFWYAQNILMFARFDYLALESSSRLKQQFENTKLSQLAIVHPKKYLEVVEQYLAENKAAQWYASELDKYSNPKNWSLKKLLSALPVVAMNTLQNKLYSKNR